MGVQKEGAGFVGKGLEGFRSLGFRVGPQVWGFTGHGIPLLVCHPCTPLGLPLFKRSKYPKSETLNPKVIGGDHFWVPCWDAQL